MCLIGILGVLSGVIYFCLLTCFCKQCEILQVCDDDDGDDDDDDDDDNNDDLMKIMMNMMIILIIILMRIMINK